MPVIFETNKFVVEGPDSPHHDRDNGGHAKVFPRKQYSSREEMSIDEYFGLMGLVKISGEAIMSVMRGSGLDVVRINYQDNGNWSYFPKSKKEPHLHVHMYVRINGERHPNGDDRFRAFPEALNFPYIGDSPDYYDSFKPFSEKDCIDIRSKIERLLDLEINSAIKNLL